MSEQEMFEGFSEEQQAEYEKEAMEHIRPRNRQSLQRPLAGLQRRRKAAHF